MPTTKGAFKIFTFSGIGVYVHWMWVLVFFYYTSQPRQYSSYAWNALEVLSLFFLVLLHEFGHQLACRQAGGKTHDIVLWVLGGVAFVSPPQRPAAQLWSIAAGPLVNVVLIPVLSVLVSASSHLGWYDTHPDLYDLCHNIWLINILLLKFNLLPIYPLDGGQILRSLLWFVFGHAKSLLIATVIGFIGLAVLLLWVASIYLGNQHPQNTGWYALIAIYIAMNCWGGLQEAWTLSRLDKLPRHENFACPSCKTAPPAGELWRCNQCSAKFDAFLTQGICPRCAARFDLMPCLDCGNASPIGEWVKTE